MQMMQKDTKVERQSKTKQTKIQKTKKLTQKKLKANKNVDEPCFFIFFKGEFYL